MVVFNALLQISLSLYWIWHYGYLLYAYNFTDILFAFMYPTWGLILLISLGILGVINGILLLLNKVSIKKSYFRILILLVIGIFLDMVSPAIRI